MNGEKRQQTILIVDDNENSISALTKILQPDFHIKKALTSEAALSIAFSERPPELILINADMPGIDGYEVCKRLKQSSQTKSIPVILLTEKANETDELYRFNAGAVDSIQKPFNTLSVRSRVNTQAELKKHRDYLEEISYSDSLTGIYNRKKFNEFLELSWDFAKKENLPVTLILMDVDCFRQYNEHYGHQSGDSCLTQITTAISKHLIRKTDFLARYSGKKLGCILLGVDSENSVMMSERLRRGVEELKIPHAFSSVSKYVTLSFGVSTMIPTKNNSADTLLKSAEEALKQSKTGGKNRVTKAVRSNGISGFIPNSSR